MTTSLTLIMDIYAAMQQANIGKLLTMLDNPCTVHTCRCMQKNASGRELILQQIPVFYSPCTEIAKVVETMTEQNNLVTVVGHVRIAADEALDHMPFADIWRIEDNKVSTVYFYYRDPEDFCQHLSRFM